MKDERLYLIHIVEALRLILRYGAAGEEVFRGDVMTQDAMARRFEIVGEATKRLSPELRARAPHIPWGELAGFRDVLAHQYERVDLDEVWRVVSTESADLLTQVETFLAELGVRVPEGSEEGHAPES